VDLKREIVRTQEERIQKDILDRVLGDGKASAVVDLEIDLRQTRKESQRAGSGSAEKYKEKGGGNAITLPSEYILPGIFKQKNILDPSKPKPEASQGQSAAQLRSEEEEFYTQSLIVSTASVKVFVDEAVAEDKKKEVREHIVEAMSPLKGEKGNSVLTPDYVYFIAQKRYQAPAEKWLEDLKKPSVYLPLLYAFLLLIFLLFLFGPFAGFLRRYTKALAEKPAAEVNVESNIEPPEDEGEGGGGGAGAEEGMLDIMVGQKPPEAPPPPPDEEEEMKKFEPFAYINEENLKRLANLFLLRREEPWLIAVVLSYLKPEFARQVLTSLPVELQAKVAMEALKVRQVTRDQLVAIDAEIKENVDFVVGGIERLTRMLEEADTTTRMNILEYLKNEKPAVYEHVRKSILLFEDIAGFPDREMQLIVRALKAEDMAKALHGAPPEVVEKFFKNMSANAASMLKEQMEYLRDLTPAQIEEERAKIMEQVKAMEKNGQVRIREEEAGGFQEVLATEDTRTGRLGTLDKMLPSEAKVGEQPIHLEGGKPLVNPEEAQRRFSAGVEHHQAGNLDEAVKCFRQALEFDPELWQAYQYLGAELYQMGRMPEAIMYYEKLLERSPDPQVRAWVETCKAQLNS